MRMTELWKYLKDAFPPLSNSGKDGNTRFHLGVKYRFNKLKQSCKDWPKIPLTDTKDKCNISSYSVLTWLYKMLNHRAY